MCCAGCYTGNVSGCSDTCLWASRAGAEWGCSCGSSNLPGVFKQPLVINDRWGWLALNSVIALRLHFSLLLSSVVHLPLSSSAHTRRHLLFKVWEEIQHCWSCALQGFLQVCPQHHKWNRACRRQLLQLIKAMHWEKMVPSIRGKLGELGLSRKSLKANVFFFSSKFRVSVSMHVYYIRTYIFWILSSIWIHSITWMTPNYSNRIRNKSALSESLF